MSVTLYTRLGRGRGIGVRLTPLWLLFFFAPLWLAEALTRLLLWCVREAMVESVRSGATYRRSHPSRSERKAAVLALTRGAIQVDAETAALDRLGVWAVYGIGDRFFHGRFPQEAGRLRALFPSDIAQLATVGVYPNATSAGRVARGLQRHGFTVSELESIFLPLAQRQELTISQTGEPALTEHGTTTKEGDGMAVTKSEFVVGEEYPLALIQEAFGGDNMSYLPETGGRIVCGRFTTDMNPNAPERVLVGDRPRVKRKAELLAQQGGMLPVFMKQGPNRWRYHGLMRFVEYVTDSRVVEPEAKAAGRAGEIAGVLVLRPA